MYAKQEVRLEDDHGREYADQRLRMIYSDHCETIRKQFLQREVPKTSKETEEWLKAGKYHFDFEDEENHNTDWFSPFDFFRWGSDKDWKPDRVGFRAADKALDKAWADAKDLVHITTDENKRLEAIETFKKWKYKN